MEKNHETPSFIVNIDKKQRININNVGLSHPDLISILTQQDGLWFGDNIKTLTDLDVEFNSFMDISDNVREHIAKQEPFITVDFPDNKTEIITIHRLRKK